MFVFIICALLTLLPVTSADQEQPLAEAEIVYQWNTIEYDWPSESMKEEWIANGSYIPKNSAVNGIKTYKGKVYVTVPRHKYGVPSTLNVVVENTKNRSVAMHVLRPFPSWDMQTEGDCDKLQLVQSMEIDPNTGWMWVIDTGYVPKSKVEIRPVDACGSKLLIYDLDTGEEIHRYHFPKLTVGEGLYYLNDIVLDYHNGSARYAYISDTLDYKLVVYDHKLNKSYQFNHVSMEYDQDYTNITISNMTLTDIRNGINGIALSQDFNYLYYSSVAGVGLYQVPTSVLRERDTAGFRNSVRRVGSKVSQGDGMVYGAKGNLYYSALGKNAVHKWEVAADAETTDFSRVELKTDVLLVSDAKMDWVDTMTLDDQGYLWFTTNRLQKFFHPDGVSGGEANFIVWKVFVNDYSYLNSTWRSAEDKDILGAGSLVVSSFVLMMCLCAALSGITL